MGVLPYISHIVYRYVPLLPFPPLKNDVFGSENTVRVWRTGRHTPTNNSQESTHRVVFPMCEWLSPWACWWLTITWTYFSLNNVQNSPCRRDTEGVSREPYSSAISSRITALEKFQFFKTVCQFRYLDTSILRSVIGNKNCFRGCDLIFFTIDASLNCLKSTFLLLQNFSDNLYLGNVILQSLFMFVQNLFMAFKHLPQITCRSLVFLFIGWWSDKAFKQCFRFQLNL